jgi:hypothetical protein
MKTQSDKERRREKHRSERRMMFATLSVDPKAMVRCLGCGGKVKMPCRLCAVRGVKC